MISSYRWRAAPFQHSERQTPSAQSPWQPCRSLQHHCKTVAVKYAATTSTPCLALEVFFPWEGPDIWDWDDSNFVLLLQSICKGPFVLATTSVGRQCREYSNQSFPHEMVKVESGTIFKHPGNVQMSHSLQIYRFWVSETQNTKCLKSNAKLQSGF